MVVLTTSKKSRHGSTSRVISLFVASFTLVAVSYVFLNTTYNQSQEGSFIGSALLLQKQVDEQKSQRQDLTGVASNSDRRRQTQAILNKDQHQDEQRDFFEIAKSTGTDKVKGSLILPGCLDNPSTCTRPNCTRPKCRTGPAHFYETIYNRWLGPWSNDRFQFLEIGFYTGKGFEAFSRFLPAAEMHSMEISCVSEHLKKDGTVHWPWENAAVTSPLFNELRQANRLHCGDSSQFRFLNHVWTEHLKRPDAPPLKVVVEDASHRYKDMAMTLFFWFPRIAPGGILVVEDIEPFPVTDKFRTGVLPQVMYDMHYCGDPETEGRPCFPTIQPLLQSVHCEMHICVFERNNEPAWEPNESDSSPPPHADDATQCLLGKL